MRDATVLKRQEKPLAPLKEREVEERLPAQEQDVADRPTQAHVPAAEPLRRPAPPTANSAARELRVKVWPPEEFAPAESARSEKGQKSAGGTRSEAGTGNAGVDTAVDDLPTRPLVVNPPTPAPSMQRTVNPPSLSGRQERIVSDVDRMDTTPLLAPESSRGRSVSTSAYVPVEQAGQVEQRPWQGGRRDALDRPSLRPAQPVTPPSRPIIRPQQAQSREIVQQPVSPMPPVSPLPLSPNASVQERTPVAPPVVAKTGAARRSKRSGRTPLVILLAALALLIFGGLAAWIIVFHPFTVPVVTQPRQTFSNTQLGLSVQYPSGWTAQANASKGTVLFADSSHTGQVKILVTAVSGDLKQYLSNEATQLGMTGVKPGSPLSFAGTSWQQVQGSLQVSGANYTAVLLAAVHGGHIYTVIQMAPQVTYTDEEHIIFSPLRSSFHFLP